MSKLENDVERWISLPSLNAADIGSMKPRDICKFLLRQPEFSSAPLNFNPKLANKSAIFHSFLIGYCRS